MKSDVNIATDVDETFDQYVSLRNLKGQQDIVSMLSVVSEQYLNDQTAGRQPAHPSIIVFGKESSGRRTIARAMHNYLGQLELRFHPNKWVGLVGFTALGDTADRNPGDFGTPRFIKGVGLRIGLPPDHIAMARMDFGWADDESTIVMNFNQAF